MNGMDSRQPLNEGDGTPWLEILPGEVLRHRITAESGQRIRLWALTLDSRSVPCQIDKDQHGWRLLVPPEQYAAAVYELRRFEELDRNCPPPDPPHHPLTENTLATLSVLILLATFHNITQLDVVAPSVTWSMPVCNAISYP